MDPHSLSLTTTIATSGAQSLQGKMVHCFSVSSGLCDRKVFRSLTEHLHPPVANIFGSTTIIFLGGPPWRVFEGFSSYLTYSTPLSSLLNEKSSTNMSWCSRQPRNPKCCVKNRRYIVTFRDFGTGCQEPFGPQVCGAIP